MNQQEWLQSLRRAGAAVKAASAAVDAAFTQLEATVRAARRAGRTVAHLVTVTGLSKARVDEAIAADPGPAQGEQLPHSDTDLRIAAYTASAAVAEHLAARNRRDALLLQAGAASGLSYKEIAVAAGTTRRYEWQVRTGRAGVDRKTSRQDVFEGAGMEAHRATENASLRRRRQAVQTGVAEPATHGLHGYQLGCRCEVCLEARRAVQEGAVEVRHGLYGYRSGCRCEVCRSAHAGYHREWRRRRSARSGAGELDA